MRLGLGLLLSSTTGSPYSAEATSLFARMTTQPDDTRKAAINTLIVALKAAGSWAKMDALYVCAAHEQPTAKLNWIAAQYDITDPGTTAPTFTTDRGFTGDGTSDYLDTGFNPTTAGSPKFALNSAHMGIWIGTDVTSTTRYDFGSTQASINAHSSANVARIRANSGSVDNGTLPADTGVGWTCWARGLNANYELVKNGGAPATITRTAAGVGDLPFYLLAVGSAGPVPASFSNRRFQAAHFGSDLSDAELLATYNALAAYMTAVGA